MASPFTVFRRNQKVLLAVVGVAAMVAFVFLDPLMKYVGRSTRQENPVVVETKYGPITESDLQHIRGSRDLVEVFLRKATDAVARSQMEKGQLDARNADRFVEQWYSSWHQRLLGRSKLGPEQAALETLVLAKKAEQMGMVVSDRTINEILKQVTADVLTSEQLQAIIGSLQPTRRLSVGKFFEALRTELLAANFMQMFSYSLGDVTPAQRFEYFARLNRRAQAEVMPLAVADYVDKVEPGPTSEQLQAFYDEHKNTLPDPTSPEPGFKQAKRAALQYFKADYATLKEQLKPQVTEAEIAEYYDKNKAQFRALDLPAADIKEETEPTDEKPAEKPDEKPAENTPADEQPAATPGEDKPAEPAADKPAEQPNAESDKKPADAEPPKSSSLPANASRPSIRLVSLAISDEQTAKPPADAESEKASAAETPPVSAIENKPGETETKPGETAAGEAAKEGEASAAVDANEPKEAALAPTANEKPAEEIKYDPLEKVQDTIRESIADQKAREKIGAIFEELSAEMRRYADDLDLYSARKGTDPTAKPPQPFPFQDLAKKHNVQARETELMTAAEAAETDIGKVSRPIQDRRSQFGFRMEPFGEFAFSDGLLTYKATSGEDQEGNAYLFWKTRQEAAFVPTLDAIRDQVVLAWKMIKARTLATKRGEELALQARTAKKPMKEVFANQDYLKVTETGPFSWLTTGSVPSDPSFSQPHLSSVDGVESAGSEFMEKVFSLAPGEVGVAMNQPQTIAYVVRLDDFEKSIDDLRTDFASENRMRYMSIANFDQRQVYLAWLDELNKDARVHWIRPADVATARRSAAPEPDDSADF